MRNRIRGAGALGTLDQFDKSPPGASRVAIDFARLDLQCVRGARAVQTSDMLWSSLNQEVSHG
jgi:hypothetical protein